ncbi:hypothetical protein ACQP00_28470 [Dactylosporangium sp. CS-047395]|uniref:hypothetical protein n=1 Tax=Dactylosporangium sp. CS-047395 TaxID=3239936 RepID=UPI003D9193F3
MTLPRLAPATRLPGWALQIAAAGCAFIAAGAWTMTMYANHVLVLLTDEQVEQLVNRSGTYLDLFWLPKMVLCVAGFAALAIAGWRRRAISRGACALLGLAAVVSLLPPHPPTGVLAGLALVWAVRSAAANGR